MVAHKVRCNACRQRKIKCDQQWSTPGSACGQCRKSKRHCSGPPNKLKFVINNSVSSEAIVDHTSPRAASPPFLESSRPSSLVSRLMPPTHANRIGAEVVDLLTSQPKTFGFSSFAKLLTHIPAMLETSSALRWSMACLLDARKRQMVVARPRVKVNPMLYSFALQDLRNALQSLCEVQRIETLMAILVMEYMESVVATPVALPKMLVAWSVHLSGVGSLLEQLSPEKAKDKLIFDVLLEVLPQLAGHFYARDEPFFMTSPEWRQAVFERENCTAIDNLLLKVCAQFSDFPDVARDLRRYHIGEVRFEKVLSRVQAMVDALDEIEGPLQVILEDLVHVKKRATSSWISPVEEVYEAEDSSVPRICCLHAIGSLCAYNMLEALIGDSTHELEAKSYTISRRIWMFHEQAAEVGSFGMHPYPTALLLTYGSAQSEDTKDWVVNLLNELQGRNPETDVMFTHDEVFRRCYALSGRLAVED